MKNGLALQIRLPLALLASMVALGASYGAPAPEKPKQPGHTAAPPKTAPIVPLAPGNLPAPAPKSPVPIQAKPVVTPIVGETEKAIAKTSVTAAGATWQCTTTQCATPAPASFATLDTCRALAQQIGRLKSFGSASSKLNAADLAQCNQAVPATVVSAIRVEAPKIASSRPGQINVEANYLAKHKAGVPPGAPGSGIVVPLGVEANYIAKPKGLPGTPGTPVATPAIAVEANYTAHLKAGVDPATVPRPTAPIAVEANYTARHKAGTTANPTVPGPRPIGVEANFIARPAGRN